GRPGTAKVNSSLTWTTMPRSSRIERMRCNSTMSRCRALRGSSACAATARCRMSAGCGASVRASAQALERREQHDVADAGAIGQQHDQAVDADSASAGRRHAVLQGANVVVVVVHGFEVAGLLGLGLGTEPGGLVLRVVQLGETVGDLAARNEEFEALRGATLGIGLPRQRRHLDRIVDD